MDLSPQGAQFVRLHEGFVPRWYADPVGVGTIGIGFTWGSDSFRKWWAKHKPGVKFGPGATMTQAEAEDALVYLFANEYGKAVNKFLGRKVPQHVFDGMASPVFNLGVGSLKWKWAAAAKAGDYAGAAALLRTTGVTAKGKKLPGLVRRRKEEALLLERGIYTGVRAAKESPPVPAPAAQTAKQKSSILRRGSKGEFVTELQANLNSLGYGPLDVDGVFRAGTEKAVKKLQSASGIKADGWAGPRTQEAIGKALQDQETAPKLAAAEEVVDAAASEGKAVSKTEIITTITGATGAVAVIKDAVDTAKDGATSLLSLGPWILLVLVLVSGAAFVIYDRRKKRLAARKAQEAMR